MPTDESRKNAHVLKVAIVHDWLNGSRGGERVLEAMLELYPDAEIFTLFYTPGTVSPLIERHPIHVSFLNSIPIARKYYRYVLPLLPMAIETFDLRKFNLVISSSHCVAKGAITSPDTPHICYCYTPMRYAWDLCPQYFGNRWYAPLIHPFLNYLRIWDASSSNRVDYFVAISEWVQKRILKYYRRESIVIHPFCTLENFPIQSNDRSGDYYLVVSAFAPYKRVDLAIEACRYLDRELWVVGEGQDQKQLIGRQGPKIRFLGRVNDNQLPTLYAGAKALLFPGEEDFGITPLEAMACGTPVIAFARGGAMETVCPGTTGILFHEQTVESLSEAILALEKDPARFNPATCRSRAEQFSKSLFKMKFQAFAESIIDKRETRGFSQTLAPATNS